MQYNYENTHSSTYIAYILRPVTKSISITVFMTVFLLNYNILVIVTAYKPYLFLIRCKIQKNYLNLNIFKIGFFIKL